MTNACKSIDFWSRLEWHDILKNGISSRYEKVDEDGDMWLSDSEPTLFWILQFMKVKSIKYRDIPVSQDWRQYPVGLQERCFWVGAWKENSWKKACSGWLSSWSSHGLQQLRVGEVPREQKINDGIRFQKCYKKFFRKSEYQTIFDAYKSWAEIFASVVGLNSAVLNGSSFKIIKTFIWHIKN